MSLREVKTGAYLNDRTHCERCRVRGHPADFGSEVACAFPPLARGQFVAANWNCATMGMLRDIAYRAGWALRWNDMSIAVMPLEEYGFLVLEYYKDRGATDKAYASESLAPITLEQAEEAIRAGARFVEYWESERSSANAVSAVPSKNADDHE